MTDLRLDVPDELLDEIARRAAELVARPQMLSKEKLAEHLGVTERTLRTWREKGLPAHRVGKSLIFNLAEVERWIEAHG
jgi:excisionase family DNA binding protein